MSFPATETGLREQGYKFSGSGNCKSCKAELAWYETPNGKAIPLDEGTLLPHWTTCPDADKYRSDGSGRCAENGAQFSTKTDGYRKAGSFDVAVLLRKIEHARTINDLALYGEEAKTAPEKDKPVLREMYAVRLKQLKGEA